MGKGTDSIKSFSVLKNELNELSELYGAGAEEFMDLHSECFDSSEDHKWSRLCNVYPELEEHTKAIKTISSRCSQSCINVKRKKGIERHRRKRRKRKRNIARM